MMATRTYLVPKVPLSRPEFAELIAAGTKFYAPAHFDDITCSCRDFGDNYLVTADLTDKQHAEVVAHDDVVVVDELKERDKSRLESLGIPADWITADIKGTEVKEKLHRMFDKAQQHFGIHKEPLTDRQTLLEAATSISPKEGIN